MNEPRPELRFPEKPYVPDYTGRPKRRRRGVQILPSLFTLGNLMCGFASINFAARAAENPQSLFTSHFALAGYFIFMAMVFDMFDGFVARLTRSTSDFGAELDSLADMVSFGVAPAFLSVYLIGFLLQNKSPLGTDYFNLPDPFQASGLLRLFWVIAGIYVSCTALRLARFNVNTKSDVQSHMSFRGMPSPGAAAIVAGSVIFFESLRSGNHYLPFNVPQQMQESLLNIFPYLLPPVLLVAALLMVSRFRYTHLINRFLRGRKRFRTLVGFFLLVMAGVWEPQITVLLGIYVYALSAPTMELFALLTGKKPAAALPATPDLTNPNAGKRNSSSS